MLSKKKLKLVRWLSVIVVIALVFGIVNLTSAISRSAQEKRMQDTETYTYAGPAAPTADAADPAGFTDADPLFGTGYIKAAENENLILYYISETRQRGQNASGSGETGFIDNTSTSITYHENVRVYDKRTGYCWSAILEDEDLLNGELTDIYYRGMQSLFRFNYIDLNTGSNSTTTERDALTFDEPHVLTPEAIPNGVRFNFDFTNLGFKFAADFILEGNDFRCLLRNELIEENEEGLDEYEKTKAQMNEYIDKIREYISQIEDKANSLGDDPITQQWVRNAANDINRLLITLRDQTSTGELKAFDVASLNDNLEMLEFGAGELMNNQEMFDDMKRMGGFFTEVARTMTTMRSSGISKINVLPYFGAQRSGTDGYAFYPDDCGSICYFNRVHPTMSGEYEQDVYDVHSPSWRINTAAVSLQAGQTGYVANYSDPTHMPVFGIKAGNSAFLGIIAQGDCDANIHFAPAREAIVDISNVYTMFYFRQSTRYLTAGGGQTGQTYDRSRTKQDWEIRYRLLANEDANYSGMAMGYRDFLLETGQMKESPIMNWDQPPVGLEYLIGAVSNRSSLITEYIPMTRFSDIKDDIDTLSAAGIDNLLINLTGWEEQSWKKAPAPLVINGSVGGEGGMKDLAEYVKGRNVVLGLDGQGQWVRLSNINSAVANVGTMKSRSQIPFETYGWYVLNPLYYFNRTSDLNSGDIATYKRLGANCVTTMQEALVYDYNDVAVMHRAKAASLYAKVGQVAQETLGYASGVYAPAYMLKGIDWNQYVRTENSGYSFTDEDIPFYQMVMHGAVAYTTPGNNFNYNEVYENLKYIEFGYLPFYTLTEEQPFDLLNAGYTDFTSKASEEWIDRIIEMGKAYQTDLYDVWNGVMKEHTRLTDTLAKVHYVTRQNKDVYVYINYAETPATVDGITVAAESYQVVR